MLELLVDWLVVPLPIEPSARARQRAYRHGRPVFIGAGFGDAYPWTDHLLCHGSQLWLVTHKGYDKEQRIALRPARATVEIDPNVGWSTSTSVAVQVNGRRLAISSTVDFQPLIEAIDNWQTSAA